jgi:hypothetical protein
VEVLVRRYSAEGGAMPIFLKDVSIKSKIRGYCTLLRRGGANMLVQVLRGGWKNYFKSGRLRK